MMHRFFSALVVAAAFSASAKSKIEAAGGSCTVVEDGKKA